MWHSGFVAPAACGILVPQPGIEPTSPALEGGFLTTGPPGKSQDSSYFFTVIQTFPRLSWGFPGSSTGKESACNAGDPSSIPESGRSHGEGIGYPLQYSSASLVAQTVKTPPVMQETWVQSLVWEDPLEKGMATHSSVLAWRIPMDRGAWWATVHGIAKSQR